MSLIKAKDLNYFVEVFTEGQKLKFTPPKKLYTVLWLMPGPCPNHIYTFDQSAVSFGLVSNFQNHVILKEFPNYSFKESWFKEIK